MMRKLGQNLWVLGAEGYGYGLVRTYGVWYAIPCEPSWWTAQAMGFKGLWAARGMG